jgi:hypothetical protein
VIVADTGGPDGDGPSLLDVLAALGWTITRSPGRRNTVTDPAGWSLTAHASDVWALLFRRRLITYATTPHCATCGYSTGFPPGWLEARGHQPSEPRPCQCWRLGELPL